MTSAVTSSFSRKLQWNRISRELHQQLIFGVGAAKRCRVNKLERQRFAFARISIASYIVQSQEIQAQRIEEVAKRGSRGDKSAAKQLTIYDSWMSTAELNSNGESDKKPAKEKDTRVLTAAGCGIGSVHAVVRSNLLVEPSEVEEGEM
ncbi:hypothetical protein F511_28906 [Dorcoceras hygrometricum]|uniref:Uncharacterized protein n=1 Tax=Dorcoceras hygrometricum TaxID=472368 RepID=A0A2Z7CXD0_9LAMI|nr:hypothetical protein F511_28906 [Dorcoceras hygrometricum]